METMEAINRIYACNLEEGKRDMLCHLVSEFDCFLKLKAKHPKEGLMKATYKELGIRFLGMYGINTLEDVVRKAETNLLG